MCPFPSSLKSTKGFTLIELLVVVAIIGMLASIVLVSLDSVRIKSRDARRTSDMKQIQTAVEMYRNAVGNYPNSGGAWASFDSPSYSPTAIVSPAAANLTAALAPYIKPMGDPKNLGTDSGYLYISSNGADYCILLWKTPENLKNYGAPFINYARCSSVDGNGQCVGSFNNVFIGTGQYAGGC